MKRKVAIGLVLIAALWIWYALIVTHGMFRFAGREPLWRLYSGMWRSLTQGRFDIDPADTVGEAFHRDGKTYSYWGMFPSLLRGVFSLWRDLGVGGCAQLSCALAATVAAGSTVVAGLMVGAERKPAFWIVIIAIALGSPLVVLLSVADVYNESTLWGCAWGCVFNAALIVFTQKPDGSHAARWALVTMAISSGLAIHSRPTTGIATALEFGALGVFLALEHKRPPMWIGATTIWLVLIGLAALVNYKRWGNPLEFRPIQLHEAYQGTERGDLELQTGMYGLDRVPFSFCYYFLPESGTFTSHWPFLALANASCLAGSHPNYVYIASVRMPLTIVAPALLLIAFMGLVALWRTRVGLIIAFGGFAVLAVLLTFDGLALRYAFDLVPALTGLALLWAITANPPQRQMIALASLVALSIVTAHLTTLLAKVDGFGVPASIREKLGRDFLGW